MVIKDSQRLVRIYHVQLVSFTRTRGAQLSSAIDVAPVMMFPTMSTHSSQERRILLHWVDFCLHEHLR